MPSSPDTSLSFFLFCLFIHWPHTYLWNVWCLLARRERLSMVEASEIWPLLTKALASTWALQPLPVWGHFLYSLTNSSSCPLHSSPALPPTHDSLLHPLHNTWVSKTCSWREIWKIYEIIKRGRLFFPIIHIPNIQRFLIMWLSSLPFFKWWLFLVHKYDYFPLFTRQPWRRAAALCQGEWLTGESSGPSSPVPSVPIVSEYLVAQIMYC